MDRPVHDGLRDGTTFAYDIQGERYRLADTLAVIEGNLSAGESRGSPVPSSRMQTASSTW
jgi:hypothetical protein